MRRAAKNRVCECVYASLAACICAWSSASKEVSALGAAPWMSKAATVVAAEASAVAAASAAAGVDLFGSRCCELVYSHFATCALGQLGLKCLPGTSVFSFDPFGRW